MPGVNNLKQYGRWAFVEFGDVWALQQDLAAKIEAQFNGIVDAQTAGVLA